MTRVAILGIGRMGGAMARTLARSGFALSLYNRTRAKAEQVAGELSAEVADTAAEAAADADVIISMLADRSAVEGTFLGDTGALAGLRAGTVACEMSTVEPDVVRALAERVRARGADIIDAPVSGSVPAVEQGSLTIMAGGEAAALERAHPVFDALAAHLFHMGPLGTGAAMKLAVNAVVHGLNQALSEALVLAEVAGVERSRAYDVFSASAVAAPFVHYKRAAFEDPDGTPVAFTLDLVGKDLRLILSLAGQLGVAMPQAATNLDSVGAALEDLGDRDMAAVALHLRNRVRRETGPRE